MDAQYRASIGGHLQRTSSLEGDGMKTDLVDFLVEAQVRDFDDIASQIKTLVFAGTDTTSNSREL